jgi:hypothetical protein
MGGQPRGAAGRTGPGGPLTGGRTGTQTKRRPPPDARPRILSSSPVALAQGVQAELVGDLRCVHGVGQILLVGKHQQDGVAQLVLSSAWCAAAVKDSGTR